ncbi:MAG: AAA family ATPase [Armatimonadota bacterium]
MTEANDIEVTRILLACGDGAESRRIADLLGRQPHLRVVGVAEDGAEACRMAVELKPEVALLDERLPEMDGLSTAETIWLAVPQVATMLMSASPAAILRQAMRAGVKEIIGKPVHEAELLDALGAIRTLENKRETPEYRVMLDPHLMPRVIAIAGAKGGIGKSTLSANLAVSLAQKYPGETVLVDLYSQFGDIALMLNLHPKRTLLEMLPSVDDIDEELVEAHLTEHKSGLKVLVSSIAPVDLTTLNAKMLSTVLAMLKRKYRLIVMDVPPVLYEATTYALTHATTVALVVNLFDLTTLHDTRKLYQTLQDWSVPMERVHLVLNRLDRRNRFQVGEIQRTFGRLAAGSIPNASGIVVNSINEGVPFVLTNPQAPITRSIQQLADRLSNGVS